MGAHLRKDPALVYANTSPHAGEEITPAVDRGDAERAAIAANNRATAAGSDFDLPIGTG